MIDNANNSRNCNCYVQYSVVMFVFLCVMNSASVSTEFISSPTSRFDFISGFVIKAMAADECCLSGEAACNKCTNEQYRDRYVWIIVTDWNGKQLTLWSWTTTFRWFVSALPSCQHINSTQLNKPPKERWLKRKEANSLYISSIPK